VRMWSRQAACEQRQREKGFCTRCPQHRDPRGASTSADSACVSSANYRGPRGARGRVFPLCPPLMQHANKPIAGWPMGLSEARKSECLGSGPRALCATTKIRAGPKYQQLAKSTATLKDFSENRQSHKAHPSLLESGDGIRQTIGVQVPDEWVRAKGEVRSCHG